MSELRQNILTENWAVIAPERAKRPEVTRRAGSGDIRDHAEYSETCPFCPGNEERFQTVVLDEIARADGHWQVRAIENKFKIFDGFESCPPEPEPFHRHGVYSHYQGCGDHYLFVEHPTHNRIMGEMTTPEPPPLPPGPWQAVQPRVAKTSLPCAMKRSAGRLASCTAGAGPGASLRGWAASWLPLE